MEMDQIIKLIHTVSDSNLSSFTYVEGDSSLSLENNRNVEIVKEYQSTTSSSVVTTLEKQEGKSDCLTIESPMVGTFYAAKSEDSDPYIVVGEKVKKGQIVGIVEAMKLMNEIESEFDGVVESILVKNKDVVEYGQPLVVIKPD